MPGQSRAHTEAHTAIPEDLSKIGYLEQEYFVSGLANIYTWPKPDPAVVRTPNAPYTTRILVRRPESVARFSGNVVVEPLNPSNLFDLNLGWGLMHQQLIRSGDVWVEVTVKPVSMQTLKTFDPKRYAPLAMNNPLPLTDPRNCATVPADSSRSTENGLAWDIYTQVGELIRSKSFKNPIHYGGKPLWHTLKVYGFGYSQTGGYMYDYINGVAPLARAQLGRSVYDGYIVAVAGCLRRHLPINQCEAVPALDDPRRQLSNVGVPVIHVRCRSPITCSAAPRGGRTATGPSDRYRQYEMAGAGHATPGELNFAAAPADIIMGGRAVPPMNCNEGPRSRFPSSIFFDAFLKNLNLWVRKGIAPPHGSPIVVVNGAPVLDRWGNVAGGLRSPFLDVPTSTWFGTSTGPSFCIIAGHEVPFGPDRLRALYPTHQAYVDAVVRDTRGARSTGLHHRLRRKHADRPGQAGAHVPPAG